MTYTCHHCQLQLKDKNLYISHSKKCVRTVTFVTRDNQEITVTRDDDDKFTCYCSSKKCPSIFAMAGSIQRHMNKLKTTWLGPDQKASYLASFSIQDAK